MSTKQKIPIVLTPTLLGDFALKLYKKSKRKSGFKTGKGYRKTGFKKGGQVKK